MLSASSPHGPADEPQPPQKKPFLSLDARVWPIAASTLLMGTGVGVIFPVMPMFARDLGLSSSDFGLVVRLYTAQSVAWLTPCAGVCDRCDQAGV